MTLLLSDRIKSSLMSQPRHQDHSRGSHGRSLKYLRVILYKMMSWINKLKTPDQKLSMPIFNLSLFSTVKVFLLSLPIWDSVSHNNNNLKKPTQSSLIYALQGNSKGTHNLHHSNSSISSLGRFQPMPSDRYPRLSYLLD